MSLFDANVGPWVIAVAVLRWLLVGLLAWSSIGKAVPNGTTRRQAIATAELARRKVPHLPRAETQTTVIASIEGVTVLALLIFPLGGFLVAALLFAGLAPVARLVPDEQPCGCFGAGALEFGRSRTSRTDHLTRARPSSTDPSR